MSRSMPASPDRDAGKYPKGQLLSKGQRPFMCELQKIHGRKRIFCGFSVQGAGNVLYWWQRR